MESSLKDIISGRKSNYKTPMASSSHRNLFKEDAVLITDQNSESVDESNNDGIKMNNYLTQFKQRLDDDEENNAPESQKLIGDGGDSEPAQIDFFNELNSESVNEAISKPETRAKFCEFTNLVIFSLFNFFVITVLLLLLFRKSIF